MLGGLDGLGFINTKYQNASEDFPDVEIHFIPSCPSSGIFYQIFFEKLTLNPSSDGGESVRKNMGLRDDLYLKVYAPFLYRDTYVSLMSYY